MSAAKEIRTKIGSIKNTAKITRAMEMVAASKMRKAQQRMHAERPYSDKIESVIHHLAHATTEYRHPFLLERDKTDTVGFLLISTDRGLCGGLNSNLFRLLLSEMKSWELEKKKKLEFFTLGRKGSTFLTRLGGNVVAEVADLGYTPEIEDLLGVTKVMLDRYVAGSVDRVFLLGNTLVNSMTQAPIMRQLLPLPLKDQEHGALPQGSWDYLYEPDSETVLDLLLRRYIESIVYRWVVENVACEQAARMVAMKSASDNAKTLIDELQLVYNKARQAAITQELSEIIGGAEAV